MRRALFPVVLVLSALLGFALLGDSRRGAYDFQAFYCAGRAARAGADPYRTEPLGTCEHRLTDASYAALPPGVVLPAPQPGYMVGAFALLSRAPFARAKGIFGALLLSAVALTVLAAATVTCASALYAFLVLSASLIMPSLAFGQIFPLYAAACCGAALFAQRGQWLFAGVCAAATLAEPHLGLPVCVGVALCSRRAAVAAGAGCALLAIISAAVLSRFTNVEYVTTVLPLHARAELSSDAQLSVSSLLHAFAVPDAAALALGTASYVAGAVAGIWLGRRLARAYRDPAFSVFTPAAFATLGGTFMHATELFAAIPLALLLLARGAVHRTALLGALVLIAIPWITAVEQGNTFAFASLGALIAGFIVWHDNPKHLPAALAIAALSFGVLAESPSLYAHLPHAATRMTPILQWQYPQASWQRWIGQNLSAGNAAAWFLRALSWCGVGVLAAVSAAQPKRSVR